MPNKRSDTPSRQGYVVVDGWSGRMEYAVMVIGETPKRYRIQAVMRTRLAGRDRWLNVGETTLVPKHAVMFTSVLDHSRGIKIDVGDIFRATK